MKRFIDNTLLRSVSASLAHDATREQFVDFLRFTCELLTAEELSFTADPSAAVYGESAAFASKINAMLASGEIVRFVSISNAHWETAVQSASNDLSREFEFIRLRLPQGVERLYPPFPATANPLDELHNVISSGVIGRYKDQSSEARSSNFVPAILLHEAVLPRIQELMAKGMWRRRHTHMFGISARMLAYEHVGRLLKLTYVPSYSRTRLRIIDSLEWSPEDQDLLSKQLNVEAVSRILAVVIRESEGIPEQLMQVVAAIRRKIHSDLKHVRNPEGLPRDALLYEFDEDLFRQAVAAAGGLKGELPIQSQAADRVALGVRGNAVKARGRKQWEAVKTESGLIKLVATGKAENLKSNTAESLKRLEEACIRPITRHP